MRYALFLIYVALSLAAGEFHPLSRYDMYNAFPPEAYAFSLTNQHFECLPLVNYFRYKTADLSHNYYAIEAIFDGTSSADIDSLIGKMLFSQLMDYQKSPLPERVIRLNKVVLRAGKDSLEKTTNVMYEFSQP
jgi:hypothetical protein